MTLTVDRPLAVLRDAYPSLPGYLDAATCGVPPLAAAAAMREAVEEWATGRPDLASYDAAVARSRAAFARLVGVEPGWVAVGSQAAVGVGTVAASLLPGSRVLVAEGDFTSLTYPFAVARARGVEVVTAPLERLAEATEGVDWVAFSLVQSADGRIADLDAILGAAAASGTRTLVDLTQSAGWLPVDAARLDVTVTSSYKWLCAPRGTAFTTIRPELIDEISPINANWYAGEDVWSSVYGHEPRLATDARRFDVSPAWLAWRGAVPALELFAEADIEAVRRHDVGLVNRLCEGLGLPPADSAIVSLADPDGSRRTRLATAGIRTAGRAGRLRLAAHVWNDESDVERVVELLC